MDISADLDREIDVSVHGRRAQRGWKDQILSPEVAHEQGGNIKGRGNDSCESIISFREPSVSRRGSRRDASQAIYLPLPLLISCDVPHTRCDSSFSVSWDTWQGRQHCFIAERTIYFYTFANRSNCKRFCKFFRKNIQIQRKAALHGKRKYDESFVAPD